MKRFTDTNKWRDPWFRRLSSPAKQLWGYLCDNCDSIGLVELDLTLASADCGQPITRKELLELGDRLEELEDGRLFIRKFICFQYGTLSPMCPPHRTIIKLAESHRIAIDSSGLAYHYPNATLLTALGLGHKKGKGKEEDQDQKGGVGGKGAAPPQAVLFADVKPSIAKGTREEIIAYCVSRDLPASDGEWVFDHWVGQGWKNGRNQIADWRATVRAWAEHRYFPSQNPNNVTRVIHERAKPQFQSL